jgi:hypothetical protein
MVVMQFIVNRTRIKIRVKSISKSLLKLHTIVIDENKK